MAVTCCALALLHLARFSSCRWPAQASTHGGGRVPGDKVEAHRVSFSLGSRLGRYHLRFLLLVKGSHQAGLDGQDGEIASCPWSHSSSMWVVLNTCRMNVWIIHWIAWTIAVWRSVLRLYLSAMSPQVTSSYTPNCISAAWVSSLKILPTAYLISHLAL